MSKVLKVVLYKVIVSYKWWDTRTIFLPIASVSINIPPLPKVQQRAKLNSKKNRKAKTKLKEERKKGRKGYQEGRSYRERESTLDSN